MKKTLYIILSTVLGIIVSFLFHAIIEYIFIRSTEDSAITWNSSFGIGSCALPEWLQYSLLGIGIVSGIIVGFCWWNIVYIQKRHWRNKKYKPD
ncbi:hypothetical protein KKA01_03520 [Patescibacteria group bacterium]|nr:hypothetical protein [Patescibacteria group bacterium]